MKCKKKIKKNLCEILLLLFQVGHRGHIFSTFFFLLMLDPDILKVWLFMFHKYLRYM